MNLASVLDARANDFPDRPALIEGVGGTRRALTFSQLAERVRVESHRIQSRGVRPGQSILFLHPVSIELYVALLASVRVGAAPVLVDPASGISGLRHAIRRTRPVGWSGHGKGLLAYLLLPPLWRTKRLCRLWPGMPGRSEPPQSQNPFGKVLEVDESAPALITFTSGSTGVPKAAVRSHGFLLAQSSTLGSAIDLKPGEVDLVTLPIFGLANLAHGVTSVLAASGRNHHPDTDGIRDQIRAEQVTRAAAAPAFFSHTIGGDGEWGGFEKLFTGGGPVFPRLLDRLQEASPGARICAVYGSTEAEPIAHADSSEFLESARERMRRGAGLLAGRPVEAIDLAILPGKWGDPIDPLDEAAFRSLQAGTGKAGEIVVSGEHVLSGYLDGLGDEETKFRVGERIWHRTGDEGYVDDSGRLWLLGRSGAVVRAGRESPVYPFAVETALSFRDDIARSAAIEVDGLAVLAVEWKNALESSSRREVESLAGTLGINRVVELKRIPVDKRHRSKVDYPELARLIRTRST